MKKKLSAIILCLAMVMALLPVSAMASEEAAWFEMQDFGAWGETWPNAVNVGWKYADDFDTSKITAVEVGIKDAEGKLIVKYTADKNTVAEINNDNGLDQIAYQQTHGYISEAKQSSAPFYQEYQGRYFTEGVVDADWTSVLGEAYIAWQPASAYVTVYVGDESQTLENNSFTGTVASSFAARIGDKYYASLADAVAEAKDGQEIVLVNDITITAGVENNIVLNKPVVINGGHTVTRAFNDVEIEGYGDYEAAFVINSSGVTIKNVKIAGLAAGMKDEAAIYISGNGTEDAGIVIENCEFIGADSVEAASGGSGIISGATYGDHLTIKGCTFTNVKHGMWFNGISNSVIEDNILGGVKYTGIRIEAGSENVVVSGNTMTDVASADYDYDEFASGIWVGANSTVTLKDNDITIHEGSSHGKEIVHNGRSQLVTDIGEKKFVAGGDWVEFTFSTIANGDRGTMVYGGSDFGVLYEDKIAALEYKEGDNWIDMKGKNFGSSLGFPMTDATSTFRVKFTDDAAGSYTFTASMKKVVAEGQDEVVLCSVEVPFTVSAKPHTGSGSGSSSSVYAINVASTKNGSVISDAKSAAKGDTVTLTVKANDGYKLAELTVTDKNGNAVKLTGKDNGKYTFVMPASRVEVKAVFEKQAEQSVFDDLPVDAYCADAVKWAYENGVTNGKTEDIFGTNDLCTRAQIVTFLWRATGSPEVENSAAFEDVPADAYYAKAIAWAVEKGITLGTSETTFSPDDTCTRAQSVTFLYRAAGVETEAEESFGDVLTDAYYASAVTWAVKNGVTNGTSESTFSPEDGCTRGQIVTFLYRTYQGK